MEVVETGSFTYKMSLTEMLIAGDFELSEDDENLYRYTWQHKDVDVAMPEVVHFGKHMWVTEALENMKKLHVRPATFPELILLGSTLRRRMPKEHEFVILGLDADRWVGPTVCRYIPALTYLDGKDWNITLSQFRWHATHHSLWSYAVVPL